MSKLLSALLASTLTLYSCEKCEGPPNAYETGLTLRFLSSVDDTPLFGPATAYSIDSLKLTDQNGLALPLALPRFPADAEVNFPLLQTTNRSPLSQRLSRIYFLRFSSIDQDTIQAEYELFKKDCSRSEFRTLKVSYNGRLLYEGGYSYGVEAVIRKP